MPRASISKLVLGAAALMSAPFSPPAGALADTVLFSLIDPGSLSEAYSFSFDAPGATTTVTFGGYQIPGWETVDGITVRLNDAGANLIQGAWDPGDGNSPYASTARDSSDIPELLFGGITVGHYDTYWQTIPTGDGGSYTLSFLYSNDPGEPASYRGSAGFFVSVKAGDPLDSVSDSGSVGGVPEPATWVLTLLGFAALCCARPKRQRAIIRRFDA